jgi:hypothetical protein
MRWKLCCVVLLWPFSISLSAQSVAAASREARAARAKPAPTGTSPASAVATKPSARSAAPVTVSVVPVAAPEDGAVINGAYTSKYFSLTYPLPQGWIAGLAGPPPSDTGYYVLSSFKPGANFKGTSKGTILMAAWDLFFVPRPAANAMEMVKDMQANLPSIYTATGPPEEVKIAGHAFARLDYSAPAASLHWRVLATEIRCHMVEFVLISSDTKLMDGLVETMNEMRLPWDAGATSGRGGDGSPQCLKDYATGANLLHKVDPVMAGPRYTNVPVRFIVGIDGKPKNIHVINGAPEQVKSVQDAVAQWVLKPYSRNGAAEEVETGVLFKFPPDGVKLPSIPEKY